MESRILSQGVLGLLMSLLAGCVTIGPGTRSNPTVLDALPLVNSLTINRETNSITLTGRFFDTQLKNELSSPLTLKCGESFGLKSRWAWSATYRLLEIRESQAVFDRLSTVFYCVGPREEKTRNIDAVREYRNAELAPVGGSTSALPASNPTAPTAHDKARQSSGH